MEFFSVQKGGPLKSAALFGRTVRTCLRPALNPSNERTWSSLRSSVCSVCSLHYRINHPVGNAQAPGPWVLRI